MVGSEPVVYGLYCFQCYNFKCEYSFLLLIISQGNYKLMIKKQNEALNKEPSTFYVIEYWWKLNKIKYLLWFTYRYGFIKKATVSIWFNLALKASLSS